MCLSPNEAIFESEAAGEGAADPEMDGATESKSSDKIGKNEEEEEKKKSCLWRDIISCGLRCFLKWFICLMLFFFLYLHGMNAKMHITIVFYDSDFPFTWDQNGRCLTLRSHHSISIRL